MTRLIRVSRRGSLQTKWAACSHQPIGNRDTLELGPSRASVERKMIQRMEHVCSVVGLQARGAELVGEVERYEESYRLCYVRGPEGIIVELAEQIG
jgi:hypothetical protein